MLETALASICAVLCFFVFRQRSELHRLRNQIGILEKQLEAALTKLSELQKQDSNANGLLEKVVEGLVGLGIPGLVLLVVLATSGYAGAAALTSALATLGGPLGMIGGIGVLLLLVPASRALAKYGLPKVSTLVVKGLLAKGHSSEGIRDHIRKYPSWVISKELRSKIGQVLSESQNEPAFAA